MKFVAVFLSAFVAAALGIPHGHHVIHEKRDTTTNTKFVKRAVEADRTLQVQIALKQRNLESGASQLWDISDPSSKNYGNHMTADEVAKFFAPTQDSIDTVKGWLVNSGIPAQDIKMPQSNGWISFNTTVAHLEELLRTTYHTYQHVQTRSEHIGSDAYVLPSAVSQHVDFVYPAVALAKIKASGPSVHRNPAMPPWPVNEARLKVQAEQDNCSQAMSPRCIKALYNIPNGTLHDDSNKMGLFEADNEMHSQDDLDLFYAKFAPEIPKGTGPEIDLIDWNGVKPNISQATGEAALDFDVAMPILFPQGIKLYQTKTNWNSGHYGLFNQFLDAIDGQYCTTDGGDDPGFDGTTPHEQCGAFKPANVISISYGADEAWYPADYLKRQCNEFLKLGLQGTTVVVASGDGGVAGGYGDGDCLGNDTSIFNPTNPASCPYVTAVGATVLPAGAKIGGPESAAQRFASGGGFSNIWASANYQKHAVESYFANHDPGFKSYNTTDLKLPPTTGGIYNRAGRGYPDVSAVGDYGVIVLNGKVMQFMGTSMAAPIVAAILTRINDERIHVGKPPIGFANPALYRNPAMFTDVTVGNQAGVTNYTGTCNGNGFEAVAGWDPVSGLGTPKYPEMLKYFMSL